jgi:hypothetical protein
VNHHSLAVDIADLQLRQFGASQSGRVQRHQDGAIELSRRRIDEFSYLLRTEDLWKPEVLSGVGCLSNGPRFLQDRDKEES